MRTGDPGSISCSDITLEGCRAIGLARKLDAGAKDHEAKEDNGQYAPGMIVRRIRQEHQRSHGPERRGRAPLLSIITISDCTDGRQGILLIFHGKIGSRGEHNSPTWVQSDNMHIRIDNGKPPCSLRFMTTGVPGRAHGSGEPHAPSPPVQFRAARRALFALWGQVRYHCAENTFEDDA